MRDRMPYLTSKTAWEIVPGALNLARQAERRRRRSTWLGALLVMTAFVAGGLAYALLLRSCS